jgi:hypothetical protein
MKAMPQGIMMISHSLHERGRPEVLQVLQDFMARGTLLSQHEDLESHCTHFLLDHPDFLPDTEQCVYDLSLTRAYDGHQLQYVLSKLLVQKDGTVQTVKNYLHTEQGVIYE